MVFSQLSHDEKDAFFALLDEYFQSRPGLLAQAGGSGSSALTVNAVREKASHVASAASKFLAPPPSAASRGAPPPSLPARSPSPQEPESGPTEEPAFITSVAARAAAFANRGGFHSASASPAPRAPPPVAAKAPPMPPRRESSNMSASSELPAREDSPPPDAPPMPSRQNSGAVQVKKFGDVDMSSAKGMFSSIRGGTANKSKTPPPVAPPVPSAFPKHKNTYGPPPVRRVSSNTSLDASSTPAPPALPVRKQPTPEPEPEGEWAEVLYDYDSGQKEDLVIREKDRVLVTDRSNNDWWTGELDGKSGLFPASYVNLL